jgi:hypothetical protein
MPLSESQVLKFLVDGTESSQSICWRELQNGGGYFTDVRGIRVELNECVIRSGGYLHVSLTAGTDSVAIPEPLSTSVFGQKYENEEKRELATLMHTLLEIVRRQCEARRHRSAELEMRIKEAIFRQLLFGT